jgi:hypothetical protein
MQGRLAVIVNEFDLPIHADGAENAAGDRIEKGFGQFPVIPGGDSGGIVRLGGGPQRASATRSSSRLRMSVSVWSTTVAYRFSLSVVSA